MNIENMTVQVRPRKTWEAIDLGFSMAQQWFLPLWLLWMSSALPVFIVLLLVFHNQQYWALLILWWLKPLFEQHLLNYMSRSLFGEYPSVQAIRMQYRSILFKQWLAKLTLQRLSLARSFNAPVAMLEGLSGDSRRKRLAVLHRGQGNSQWLTTVIVHLEAILYGSLLILFLFLAPQGWLDLEAREFFTGDNIRLEYAKSIAYFLALSLLAPFYVAAGFALYLTRRSELEAWDIELNFKKLRNRHQHGHRLLSILFACSLCLVCLSHSPAALALDKQAAKTSIESIVAQDDFGKIKTVTIWESINQLTPEEEKQAQGWLEKIRAFFASFSGAAPAVASLLEALLWIGGGLLLIYLVLRFTRWMDWMGLPRMGAKSIHRPPPPSTLFGLAVNADSLPDDVCAAVRTLLHSGELRPALALLYRASLIQSIHLHQLEITEAFTEGECQRLVQQQRPEQESRYFSQLSASWLLLAYAHEQPAVEYIEQLCSQWPQFYQGADV